MKVGKYMDNMNIQLISRKKVYFSQIPNSFRDREDINWMEKAAWITLTNYAGEKGQCFPSLNTISKISGFSVNTVKKYFKKLEEKGGLYICERYDKATGKQLSNRYYVIDIDYQTGQFDKSLLEPLKILYPDKKIFE